MKLKAPLSYPANYDIGDSQNYRDNLSSSEIQYLSCNILGMQIPPTQTVPGLLTTSDGYEPCSQLD